LILKLYFILILYFLISLPTLGIIFGVSNQSDDEFRASENRVRSQFRPTKVSKILPSFENFFNDRYLYRTSLRKLLVKIKQGSWSGTINGNKVFKGKDDYLFLGNHYNRAVDGFRGIHDGNSEKTVELLKKIDSRASQLHIKFRLIVAPNKHTVFSHKIPDFFAPLQETYLHKLRQSQAHKYGFIDVMNEFHSLPDDVQKYLYPKTDSHWTQLGARHALCALLNSLDIDCKTPGQFRTEPSTGFDLARIAGIKSLKKIDFATRFLAKQAPTNFKFSIVDIENGKTIEQIPPIMKLGKKFTQIINYSNVNSLSAVIARDSFAIPWFPLGLAHNFQETIVTHWTHLGNKRLSEKILASRPNIFVLEIVERSAKNINPKLEILLDLLESIDSHTN